MKSEGNNIEDGNSRLRVRSIVGLFCLVLGIKDLLAWAEFTPVDSGWLARVTGADWLEPFAGLGLAIAGVILTGPSVIQCFAIRDDQRRQARRWALAAALVSGAALVYSLDTLVPSKQILLTGQLSRLSKEVRRSGLMGLLVASGGWVGFLLMRRRDVGFWKVGLPVHRDNEIWRMSIKAEIALRAVAKNDEAYRLLEERAEYIQAEIGGRFDLLCRHLVKESADLATIDSTARLQMDVGHVFKRYADFHVRLAETRHRIADEIRQVTGETLVDMLENKLPGQKIKAGADGDVKVSISYPVLNDAEALKKRREEWEETMRGVVSIGATTGNQIIGEWIDRAARGDITAEEMPAAVELIRSLCPAPASDARALGTGQRAPAPALGFSGTAKELHDWIGRDESIESPGVAGRIKAFFSEKKLMLANCNDPEVSAEALMDMVRSEYGGILTLQSIAAVLGKRRA
jgi:hypothetical protein